MTCELSMLSDSKLGSLVAIESLGIRQCSRKWRLFSTSVHHPSHERGLIVDRDRQTQPWSLRASRSQSSGKGIPPGRETPGQKQSYLRRPFDVSQDGGVGEWDEPLSMLMELPWLVVPSTRGLFSVVDLPCDPAPAFQHEIALPDAKVSKRGRTTAQNTRSWLRTGGMVPSF